MIFLSQFLSLIKDSSWGTSEIHKTLEYFDEEAPDTRTFSSLAQLNYLILLVLKSDSCSLNSETLCSVFRICIDSFVF